MHIDPPMAQDFVFVGFARERRNTLRISSSRADPTETKDKPAVGQYAFVGALVRIDSSETPR